MNRTRVALLVAGMLTSPASALDESTADTVSGEIAAPVDGATEEPTLQRQFLGAGTWESGRDGAGKRGWQVELKRRGDDSFTGRIRVIGSAVVQEARVEAQVTDGEIYGVLVGDDDKQIGTFSGLVMKDGLSGTYKFENGDSGEWRWGEGIESLGD
jgi:hypothetical protein